MNTIPPLTHPETAWLLMIVAPALTLAALLAAAILGRRPLALLVTAARAGRARRAIAALPLAEQPDPALVWVAETAAPERLVFAGLGVALALSALLSLTAPIGVALVIGAPLAVVAAWALAAAAGARYVTALERELTGAVGRLGALLRASVGLRQALERVTADLPRGPLRAEWEFLITRPGVPVAGGGIATAQQVVAALADQTPSRRHAVFLNHLGASIGQPQEVLARRCEAAYTALQRADRRRDEAATELSQMRYSGIAVGLAGVVMAAYLGWSQWDRVVAAYSTPLGLVVGVTVLVALALPIIGGFLLARVEDSEY